MVTFVVPLLDVILLYLMLSIVIFEPVCIMLCNTVLRLRIIRKQQVTGSSPVSGSNF